jgi:four helix bundle protein
MENGYQNQLKLKIKGFAHLIYRISKDFPREESYGMTSQIRRAAISVLLNCVEGYARQSGGMTRNFFKTSYGSLKETVVLVEFARDEGYIQDEDAADKALKQADEIGAMLWRIIQNNKSNVPCSMNNDQ